MATKSRSVKERFRFPLPLSDDRFICVSAGPVLVRLEICAHVGAGDELPELRKRILGNKEHVTRMKEWIFLQIALLLHLLHVDQLRFHPLIVDLAKQHDLWMFGWIGEAAGNRDRL